MNGPQDMGGFTGFGPINPEPDEPVFHAAWERRAFALTLAMGMTGQWNIDAARHARESLAAAEYWQSSYYEIWLAGLASLMRARGLVIDAELERGRMMVEPKPVARVAEASMALDILKAGGSADRPAAAPPRFAVGHRVLARNLNPQGHTRLPRYARGKRGDVVRVHGCHVFPDSSAHGKGDDPHWLYNVRFAASDLWGEGRHGSVHIDLWEPYLEHV
jgi:nitrile hydratase subunit beta